jgi:hypothetical protein
MTKGKRAGRGEGSIYQRNDKRGKKWVASFIVVVNWVKSARILR